MFNVKDIQTTILQIEAEKGLSRDTSIGAVEAALSMAYKREFSKTGQEIRAKFNQENGEALFFQVKIVFDTEEENKKIEEERQEFNEDKHILLNNAKLLKNNVSVGDEILFPLDNNVTFGRIAAQAAKQTLAYYFRDAERKAVIDKYMGMEGSIVTGSVRRFERGNLFIDLGKTVAVMPFYEQIKREHFKVGDRVRALIISVDRHARHGSFLTLSRSSPDFVKKLFEQESPEVANESVSIRHIVRDPGTRTKLSATSSVEGLDPIGALVGQRGVRVLMVRNELQGEQIDVIEWSDNEETYLERALSPADVFNISLDKDLHRAVVQISDENIPVVLSYGGQNIRLASRLTGWEIDILSNNKTLLASTQEGEVAIYIKKEESIFEAQERVLTEEQTEETSKKKANGGDILQA